MKYVDCDICGQIRLDTSNTREVNEVDGQWLCASCHLAYLTGKLAGIKKMEQRIAAVLMEGKDA